MITVVNMIPQSWSSEANQDSEPNIAVNPANPQQIVCSAFTYDTPAAGNMVGSLAPLYVSNDGGTTWNLNLIVPSAAASFPTNDITVRFASTSGNLYAGILRAPFGSDLNILRTNNVSTPMTVLVNRTGVDQPYINAATVLGPVWSPDLGKDRVYVGSNDGSLNTATIDESLDAATAPSPANFSNFTIDFRPAPDSDNFQTRFAVHQDGTVYGIFYKRLNFSGSTFTGDVVVVRDDAWGGGPNPFRALVDRPAPQGDGIVGLRAVRSITVPLIFGHNPDFGNERIGGDLAIAVDPRNSQWVYIAYIEGTGTGDNTIHIRRSLDGGLTWSPDLRTAVKAKNPGLAINSRGVVGFLYQQVVGPAGNSRWVTHCERSANNFITFDDFILANVSATSPAPQAGFGTYIGDYTHLMAVGKDFYGVFSASNYPDMANFPNGITYQRLVDWTTHTLLPVTGTTAVPVSIDSFFFKVTDEAQGVDFYVRDWTDSMASGDNGIEPSTHANFFTTSDVWNQRSSTPTPPNANDQPVNEDPTSGVGTASSNYAFARIRRNSLPPGGFAPATVTAHFLVSEFGTGSNYVDSLTVDTSDPDVSFPALDPTVNFSATEYGPKITAAYPWNLGPTASNHLCLAVEISSPGDAYVIPGLTGHAPGWPSTDLAIIDDNNKAQRNMQVYHTLSGMGATSFYGLAHNATIFPRDMILQYGAVNEVREGLGEAFIEVIGEKGVLDRKPFQTGDTITLEKVQPGENRWIGLTVNTSSNLSDQLPVTFYEMVGNTAVNGFTIAAQPSSLDTVIRANLEFHNSIFARMAAAFHVAGAKEESKAALRLLGEDDDADDEIVMIEEEVIAAERPDSGEVDIIVEEEEFVVKEHALSRKRAISAKVYANFLRKHVHAIKGYFSELLQAQQSVDAFDIQVAIANLENVLQSSDGAHATSAHTTLLHKLDAFFTMLQKTKGDRADILQNVIWQSNLYANLPLLQAHSFASHVLKKSQEFIRSYEAREIGSAAYPGLIKALLDSFRKTAKAVDTASFNLEPAIVEMEQSLKSPTALQKAHRSYLLQLQSL